VVLRRSASEWAERRAPDSEDLTAIAERAFSGLPERFRALCGALVIRVEDFPTNEVLDEMNLESPFDILGLFQGIGLPYDSAVPETGRMPNLVFLYRRPILDYWAEHEETLGAVVSHVLVHEIGHHFGLSDEDMERIEAAAG
jgi:predicted Zn-dependent protease with MMP-like domain